MVKALVNLTHHALIAEIAREVRMGELPYTKTVAMRH